MNVLGVVMTVFLGGITGAEERPLPAHDPAIASYVAFLGENHLPAVDYIMHLFDDHDIVILCERWHPETTQWDLIFDVTRDPRFIDRVGHVFTEYVTVSLQPYVDDLMTARNLPEEELTRRVLHIFRNFGFMPRWDKAPFFDYLRRLYRLNNSLPDNRKIQLHVTDLPFDWSTMTAERYGEIVNGALNDRDRHIADVVIEGVREIRKSSRRKKCLVIMNYRHAFQPVRWHDGGYCANTGTFVFQAFPNTTANVLINTIVDVPTEDKSKEFNLYPPHDGKWDAAFAVRGNPHIGFDFAGSPFGDDSFDLFPYDPGIRNLPYRAVFTGFVFYKPIREHHLSYYVPGLYDEQFLAEVNRRFAIFDKVYNRKSTPLTPDYIKRYEAKGPRDVKDSFGYAKQEAIDRWLK